LRPVTSEPERVTGEPRPNPLTSASNDGTTGARDRIEAASAWKFFLALAVLAFLLRIFYAGHLYQDDGLWFTAAEEILRGKSLYREIYFDKPPALPLLYAALFKIFGAHILVIRLFTILYSLAISSVLYLFGKRLYDRRAGLLAAAMFTLFSTTYTTGHFQGLNTDFLMALPYAAGAYFLVRSLEAGRSQLLALTGGVLAGIAFQVNPKAIFDLVFFAALVTLLPKPRGRVFALLLSALTGFIAGAAVFLIYIAATHSLAAYWLCVWDWGSRYAAHNSAWKTVTNGFSQTVYYFAINNTLLVALAFVIASTVKHAKRTEAAPRDARFRADLCLLVWLAASYAGLAVGGRFYGHYFFQVLPSLCLIGARGLVEIASSVRGKMMRRVVFALLAMGLAVTLVRYHTRTVVLAVDWVRGTKSASTAGWYHERQNREERMVAARAKGLSDPDDAADHLGLEAIRQSLQGDENSRGSSAHIFVWGYRPEIYYWSGLLPASRYLSTQPLTGVAADAHYFHDNHLLVDEARTAAARVELAGELNQTQPEYIIDEVGFYNPPLAIKSYPELREVLASYKDVGATGRFYVYRKKNPERKHRRRQRRGEVGAGGENRL
jgi:hypothetical protein